MKRFIITLFIVSASLVTTFFISEGLNLKSDNTRASILIFLIIGVAVLVNCVKYLKLLHLKLKYKTFFKLYKEDNANELIQEVNELLQTSNKIDINIILLSLSNKGVFYSPLFYKLLDEITKKDYIIIKHYYKAIHFFAEKDYNNFFKEIIKFKSQPRNIFITRMLEKMDRALEFLANENINFNEYIKLNKNLKNKVLIDILEQKNNFSDNDFKELSLAKPNNFNDVIKIVDSKNLKYNQPKKITALSAVIVVMGLFSICFVLALVDSNNYNEYYTKQGISIKNITISHILQTDSDGYIIKSEEYGDVEFVISSKEIIIDKISFDEIKSKDIITVGIPKIFLSDDNSEIETKNVIIISLSKDNIDIITIESYNKYINKEMYKNINEVVPILLAICLFVIFICIITIIKEKKRLKKANHNNDYK